MINVAIPNVASANEGHVIDRTDEILEFLSQRAKEAYYTKNLPEALTLFDKIVEIEPSNPVWYERRAQVKLDLKDFQKSIEDFKVAEDLENRYYPDGYKSLGTM